MVNLQIVAFSTYIHSLDRHPLCCSGPRKASHHAAIVDWTAEQRTSRDDPMQQSFADNRTASNTSRRRNHYFSVANLSDAIEYTVNTGKYITSAAAVFTTVALIISSRILSSPSTGPTCAFPSNLYASLKDPAAGLSYVTPELFSDRLRVMHGGRHTVQ